MLWSSARRLGRRRWSMVPARRTAGCGRASPCSRRRATTACSPTNTTPTTLEPPSPRILPGPSAAAGSQKPARPSSSRQSSRRARCRAVSPPPTPGAGRFFCPPSPSHLPPSPSLGPPVRIPSLNPQAVNQTVNFAEISPPPCTPPSPSFHPQTPGTHGGTTTMWSMAHWSATAT